MSQFRFKPYSGPSLPKRGQLWTNEGTTYRVLKVEAEVVTLQSPDNVRFPIFAANMSGANWVKS